MAEAITIACPECEKKITVAAEAVGKKIRCKGCEHVFVVPAAAAAKAGGKPTAKAPAGKAPAKAPAGKAAEVKKKPAPDAKAAKPKAPADDEEEDSKPYGITSMDTAPRCPECANEMESEDAIICLVCGYNTRTRQRIETKAVEDITGMIWFVWLLPGILYVLGALMVIAFDIWYCLAIDGLVGDAWYFFIAHASIKIWLVIISMFFVVAMVHFAVIRLILNPRPPEQIKKKAAKEED